MAELASIKKLRSTVKGSITRLLTYVRALDENKDETIDALQIRVKRAQNLFDQFTDLERQIFLLDAEEASLLPEVEESYFSIMTELSGLIRKRSMQEGFLTTIVDHTMNTSQAPSPSPSIKLPKINIPPFSGDYVEWQSFYDLYCTTIHEKDYLTSSQKFQYLKSLLRDEAASLLRHFSITEANYVEALQKLIQRYDRKRHTVNAFIKTFLEQPHINHVSAASIRKLWDTSDEVVRGLKALGSNAEHRDLWLIHILINKLDSESKSLWAQHTAEKDFPTLNELFDFLGKRTDALESVSRSVVKKSSPLQSSKPESSKSFATASIPSCPICNSDEHKIFECDRFKELDVNKRWDLIRKERRCFNCFNFNHGTYNCKSRVSCRHCNKKHHTLLHTEADKSAQAQPEQPTSNVIVESTVMHVSAGESQVILPTALVNIKDGFGGFRMCRALLDSTSQESFITERCAQFLSLPSRNGRLLMKGLGDSKLGSSKGKVELTIRPVDGEELKVCAFIIPKISDMLPSYGFEISQWHELENVSLADPKFNQRSTIDLLLGTEIYYQITQCDKIKLGDRLVAEKTSLGWIVAGRSCEQEQRIKQSACFSVIMDVEDSPRKFWENESEAAAPPLTAEEPKCEALSVVTTKQASDGKFIMQLPFREPEEQLASAYHVATQARERLPIAAAATLNDTYIDDHITTANTEAELSNLKEKTAAIVDTACVNLRKFSTNCNQLTKRLVINADTIKKISENPAMIKLLGLNLDPFTDYFSFQVKLEERGQYTKRSLSSDASKTVAKYSSFFKMKKIMAYVLRFIKNCRSLPKERNLKPLNRDDVSLATVYLIRYIQHQHFSEEFQCMQSKTVLQRSSQLKALNPLIGKEGIIRIGCRLKYSILTTSIKHPILLPRKSEITTAVLQDIHHQFYHAGISFMLNFLRQQFWLIRAKDAIRQVVRTHVKCFKQRPLRQQQLMGDLPPARVEYVHPFHNVGLDYAKPFKVQITRRRGQIPVKTCTSKYVGQFCQHPNPCNTVRCQNGGTCTIVFNNDGAPKFACNCPLGFTASLCEIPVKNACDNSPCQNGGNCSLKSLDEFACSCTQGYTGNNCEKQNLCASSPCQNGGKCFSRTSESYDCECPKGFKGKTCTEDVEECQSNPCKNGGTCKNTHGSYRCICEAGYTGTNCESTYRPCQPLPCQNGGTCTQLSQVSYECKCSPGFSGRNCEENIDDCPGNVCQNGGTCIDGINAYRCKCPPTYTGEYCQHDVDECALKPSVCQNGATCTNTRGSYSCICVNGWTGPDCSVNIDDCVAAACFNGATCIDGVGSFYCRCTPGKTGLLCHLDDACTSNPCHVDALCDTSPINGSFTCSCSSGYKGKDCSEDIDECDQGSPCEHNGICVNTPGSFACNCSQGFTGPRCETNVNECESHPCQNDGSCLDDPGTFRCVCMPGFTGTQCEIDIDECATQPCLNGGMCHDQINGFKCTCAIGFTGARCQINIDECLSQPCRHGGICHDSIAGYTCECPPGYTGTSCETNINDCQSSPCHRGNCIDGDNSFTCQCLPGYTGYLCQTQINECESNPCQFGGHCEDRVDGYRCRCSPGTSGYNCEINVNECHSNPCQNDAKCLDGINRYTCQCVPGYTGMHCETNINECDSNPCANDGVCMDLINAFKCECPRGFYDARCLSDVDECASNPCINGGRCEDGVNQFICHCPPGYGGKRCEQNIDECGSNPCQHGGLCRDGLNSYTCQCMPGYMGINCEINIDDCVTNPCHNGGTCIDLVNGYKCVCKVPYTGRECESKMDPCLPNQCKYGARCTPNANYLNFSCSCNIGYTGRLCNEDINECALSSPCRNGASCLNILGSYQCNCAKGYEGHDCAINTDDCAAFPCQNGGTCLDGIGDYTCICVDGFEGKNCEVDIDECLSKPCQNGARCNQYVNSYTCTCRLGFSGMNCQTNDEDCTDSLCMNNGTCIDGINSYRCSCVPGYTGSNCQYKINKCDSQPCSNGATCHDQGSDYTCHCSYGYTGKQCMDYVDWCNQNPCQNSATCEQRGNKYYCTCATGWTGKLCDVEMVSCNDAAIRKTVNVKKLCNNGTCEDFGNSHRCHCHQGYTGSYCQKEINECDSAPCQNGATCKDLVAAYQCLCKQGFEGHNCESNIDDCKLNPCQNGGTCHDLVNKFKCSCPSGTIGILCEINEDDCVAGACHNNGTCVDKVGGFECQCPPGFVGSRCEGDINECLSNPCSNPGTLDCVQLVNDYHCNCKPGHMGRHCEIKVDYCANSPCQNGGVCSTRQSGHHCLCSDGFYGKNCEYSGHDCDSNPCINGNCLIADGGGYRCNCPIGTTGVNCEEDIYDECQTNPCKSGAQCRNKLGGFECICPPNWSGKLCDSFDRYGWYNPDQNIPLTYDIDLNLKYQQEICKKRGCRAKQGNFHCDEECNTYACNFDGNDCSLGINPWRNCTASINCWQVFMDGICNEECNNPQCLFDGRDCESKLQPCNPIYDAYCQKHYANGLCDYGCNNAECNWDGLDCEKEPPQLAAGVISVILLMTKSQFETTKIAFLRDLGHQLRTTVRVKKDRQGRDIIYDWRGNSAMPGLSDSEFAKKHNVLLSERVGQTGIQVYLEIDNRKCTNAMGAECFATASIAAEFLAATASKHTLSQNFPILKIEGIGGSEIPIDEKPTNTKYVILGLIVVVLVCCLVGVMTVKRKRAHGVTWFPEGFFGGNSAARRHSCRRGPDGQEMRNLNKNPSIVDMNTAHLGHSQHWSDDESEMPQPKRLRALEQGYSSDHTVVTDYEEAEPRVWSQQHLVAADIRLPHSMMTPPAHHDGKHEIDIRGPCGMTPLMLVAVRGGGIGTGEDQDTDDSTAQVISDLLAQGAELNATMDKTGETSLHLAARYARADAAKRLLDAGADPNYQDNTGRTSLHAAVAADAMGVFQILIRNRTTNLNARMHDGTTPLILAARLAIEGMVQDLINADADINSSDNSGKTALHWAAAVNNVDAVNVLLMHGANRDAQDDKDETPLFLAAREGSFEACKALLDNFANREITDHMDRLPRDVASERLHHDIVRLLDEHVTRSTQMVTIVPNTIMDSPNHTQLITHPTVIAAGKQSKSKKRQKPNQNNNNNNNNINNNNNHPNSPDIDGSLIRRKPSVKKNSKNKGQNLSEVQLSDGALSSVESPLTNLPSPYDTASLYSNAMAGHHNLDIIPKQPPSYEDCIKSVQSMQSLQTNNLDNYGYMGSPFGEMLAPQRSGPQSVQMGEQGLSPPYSNQSPPHSVQSNLALSPQGYIGSPSPAKSRPLLPTSPTHMAAMRQATHQKHGNQVNFNNVPQQNNNLLQNPSNLTNGCGGGTGGQQNNNNNLLNGGNNQMLPTIQMGFDFGAAGLDLASFCSPPSQMNQQTTSQQNSPMSIASPNGPSSSSSQCSSSPHTQQNMHVGPFYQYLTPPSQHSGGVTPQHLVQTLDSYPTPSPESPGHWSSSSPHSTSDWSEGVQSPVANPVYITGGHQANKGSEAIYI